MGKLCPNKKKPCWISIFVLVFMMLSAHAWADKLYTVKRGDSLYKISKKFKTDINAIKGANDLDSNKLFPGAQLIIPSKELSGKQNILKDKSSKDKVAPSEADILYSADISEKIDGVFLPEADAETGMRPKTYIVKKGDTLWEISKKFSVKPKEIMALNNLRSGRIKPSQEILLEPLMPVVKAEPPVTSAAALPEADPDSADENKETAGSEEDRFSPMKDFLALIVQKTMGIPYKFGGNTFMGIDCSAYVQKVLSSIGLNLPRTAREQFTLGESVDKEDLSIGDLVFFRTYAPFPSHVGIYLGNNLFIHASSIARKVTINSLNTPYYLKRFIGAKRLPELDGLTPDAIKEPLAVSIK